MRVPWARYRRACRRPALRSPPAQFPGVTGWLMPLDSRGFRVRGDCSGHCNGGGALPLQVEHHCGWGTTAGGGTATAGGGTSTAGPNPPVLFRRCPPPPPLLVPQSAKVPAVHKMTRHQSRYAGTHDVRFRRRFRCWPTRRWRRVPVTTSRHQR
jgi:hypothetical protein